MFDRLTPDSVTIIASYLAVSELHIGVNHHNATETTSSESTWDADSWRTRAFLTEFGSNWHPMPWYIRTSPVRSSWTLFYYTSHLDLAVFFQLAAICRSWVKPMAQLSVRVPVINVREMPKFSYSLNTNFEWQKFTQKLSQFGFGRVGLEISRFDYQLLPRLRSQQLRVPAIFSLVIV